MCGLVCCKHSSIGTKPGYPHSVKGYLSVRGEGCPDEMGDVQNGGEQERHPFGFCSLLVCSIVDRL